ncbi:unnamed protein product [Aphanomyces euteiches]|uniref:Uncharacterized protein n=1 Tax=Aphanomyces euteiches TaxID=100861 RepID=A0A6G0XYZ1_9STRA|nr:hypothetical protein Ae201684_000162 [Aphanomyces euteiches]KAH9091568.1 hypothetical protein Ae201684P_011113 [Aphanomyces euteiches]KAH9136090.1 hypothetical protein AeRB84_018632 [Aphanomyces euteiches]
MSHGQNIQIPSLKRNLSGGAATNGSNAPLSINTSSHMNMSAAASLSALASGNGSTERSPLQPPHRIDQHGLSSHPNSAISHSYPSLQHDRYLPGPPQHSVTSTPPTIQRAVTSSSAYNRQPITTRVSTTTVGGLHSHSIPTTGPPRMSGSSTSSSAPQQDWRMYLTIEERQAVRSKIHDAYTSTCKTYEELLHAASAIEEELLHIAAPSRLDYFKSGFEFENRVKLKREQLQGQLATMEKKANKTQTTDTRPKGSPVSGEHAAKKSRKN